MERILFRVLNLIVLFVFLLETIVTADPRFKTLAVQTINSNPTAEGTIKSCLKYLDIGFREKGGTLEASERRISLMVNGYPIFIDLSPDAKTTEGGNLVVHCGLIGGVTYEAVISKTDPEAEIVLRTPGKEYPKPEPVTATLHDDLAPEGITWDAEDEPPLTVPDLAAMDPGEDSWVKIEDVAAYMAKTTKSGENMLKLLMTTAGGNDIQSVLNSSPGNRSEAKAQLEELAHKIFPESSRSVVENTMNAVNAVLLDKNAPKRVDVRLEDKYMEINDNGIGMSLMDIFYCYLTPVRTGWGTLGDTNARFGSGSLSTLKYLVKATDRLIVSTSNGIDSYDVHFKRTAEGIKLKIVPSTRTTKGTTIKVASDSFNAEAAEKILMESLSANLDAEIYVHKDGKGYMLNDIKGYKITGDKETARFGVKGDIKKGACKVVMTVLGETILSVGVVASGDFWNTRHRRGYDLWDELRRAGWITPIGEDMALVKATDEDYRRGLLCVDREDLPNLIAVLEKAKRASGNKNIPEVIVELPKKVKLNLKRGRTGVIFNRETSEALDIMIKKAIGEEDGPELLSALFPAIDRFEKTFRAQERGMRNLTKRVRKALVDNCQPEWLYLPNDEPELKKVTLKDRQFRYIHPNLITEETLDASWRDKRYRDVDGVLCFMAGIQDPDDPKRIAVSYGKPGRLVFFDEALFPGTHLGKELLADFMSRQYYAHVSFKHPGDEEEIAKGGLTEKDRKLIQTHLAKMDMEYAGYKGRHKNPIDQEMCENFFGAIFEEETRSVRNSFIDGVFANRRGDGRDKGFIDRLPEAGFIAERLPVLVPVIRSVLLGRIAGAPAESASGRLGDIFRIDDIYLEDPDTARALVSAVEKNLPLFYEALEEGSIGDALDYLRIFLKLAEYGDRETFKALLKDDTCMRELAELLAVSSGTASPKEGYILRGFAQDLGGAEIKAMTYLGPALPEAVKYFYGLMEDDPKLAALKFFDFIEFVYIFTEENLNPAHAARLKADPDFGRRALLAWSDKRMGWASADDVTYRKRISPAHRASMGEIERMAYLGNSDMRPYFEFVSKGSKDKEITLGKGEPLHEKADTAGVTETIKYKLSQVLAEQAEREREAKSFRDELAWLRAIGSKKFDPEDEVVLLQRRKIQQAALFLTTYDQYLWVREIIQNITDEASRRGIPPGERDLFLELMASDEDRLISRIGSPMNIKLSAINNYLFVPFKSGKRAEKIERGSDKLTGEHGVGFFSMFSGNPEVNIWSDEEDGYSICLNIKPIVNDDGEMIDGECELKVVRNSDQKGAFFERVATHEPSALEAECVSARAETLAGYMDEDRMRIHVAGRKINKPKELLWEHRGPLGSIGCYRTEAETAVFQGDYYVQDINEYFASYMSDTVRIALERDGYGIWIPGDITLIADRTDINDRDIVMSDKGLGHMIRTVTCGAGLELFRRGKGEFLAYHLAKTAGPNFNDGPREKTWGDDLNNARALLRDTEVDFSRYGKSDERILILAPVVEINGEMMNSFDVFCRYVNDKTPVEQVITLEMIPVILRPFFVYAKRVWESMYIPPKREPQGDAGSWQEPEKKAERKIPNTRLRTGSVPGEFDAFAAYVDLMSMLTSELGYEYTDYGFTLNPDISGDDENRRTRGIFFNLKYFQNGVEDREVKGLSRILKGEMTKAEEARYLSYLIEFGIMYVQEKMPSSGYGGWGGIGHKTRSEEETRRYVIDRAPDIEAYVEGMKKRYHGNIGNFEDFLVYLDSLNGNGQYVPKEQPKRVEDQAYEERDSTTDIEGAGGGTRYDDVYEEGMSDADIAAEIADLGKESELVDAVLNTAASIMAMNSKKVVLAFNEQLLGLTSGKVKTLIQLLAKVKDKKSLGIFLEDLVIIPEYHYSSGDGDDAGDTGTLENRLNAMGIEDVNDPERYAIFTFDPMDIQPPNAGSYAAVRNVRIDEDSKFDPEVNYYPIFEMVAITLYWHKYGLPVDEIVRILRGKGFVGENFNLPLESIQDNFYFISFYVMPPMSGEAVEDISRNDRIIKALDSAA